MKTEGFLSFLTKPATLPLTDAFLNRNTGDKTTQSIANPSLKKIGLDDELTRFSPHHEDSWTLRDATRGLIATGGIGAGKTSGSGRKISTAFLKNGMGGLVLCVKTDEALEWEELAKKTNRTKDLFRITAKSSFGFNFLDWEQKRSQEEGGGLVTNITNFFMEIISVIDRNTSSKSEDGFWDRTLRELLSNTIVVASHLSDQLSVSSLLKVIENAPNSVSPKDEDLKSEVYRAPSSSPHPFDEICAQARSQCSDEKREELEKSITFFNHRFAALAEKTRSIIITSFTSMADPILRYPLFSLFCESTAIKPEDTFSGKIIVVDLPVHSFQFVGKIANLIWKTAFKRACQNRIRPEVPVFFWMDECQYLIDTSDGVFQTTARSSLCCTVFLTQTISNLYAEFGNQAKVDALMSCLQTKIFHQNGDHETNSWASKTIQKLPFKITSESKSKGGFLSEAKTKTITESIQWEDDVPSRVFLNLKSGGPENHFLVEGIVFFPGRKFSSGKPWIKAVFDQRTL